MSPLESPKLPEPYIPVPTPQLLENPNPRMAEGSIMGSISNRAAFKYGNMWQNVTNVYIGRLTYGNSVKLREGDWSWRPGGREGQAAVRLVKSHLGKPEPSSHACSRC